MQRSLIAFNIILLVYVMANCGTYNSSTGGPADKQVEVKVPEPKHGFVFTKKPHTKKKLIRIAVIDTGLDSTLMNESWVCKDGHKDFTGKGLHDDHGHGTHISGLIDQYAKGYVFLEIIKLNLVPVDIDLIDTEYCQIILKYYDAKGSEANNLANTIMSFRWAINQKVDIINYSGGGIAPSNLEKAIILEALDKGIKVVAAAGNERSDIDVRPYYPAMYDSRIYKVGAVDKEGKRIPASNYGKSVTDWEIGNDVLSRLPNGQFGYMTGTSQATAVKSGKLVREMLPSK